jgi:NagD protein
MVGDTMETDILGGVQLGFRTVLVLSGGTKISDLANFAYQPDMIVNDCSEIELDQEYHRELLECKIA